MTVKFKVEDMHCKHCEAAVKEAVSAVSGVSAVEVDLENKICAVAFDDAAVSEKNIIDAIDGVGFEAVKI